MKTYNVMIVEDDRKLESLLIDFFKKYNFQTIKVNDFKNIEKEFKFHNPDIVLLDINLPYYDGFYLCRMIRNFSEIPIIIMSARSSDVEQVMGIEMGADDYIVKPLSFDVLLAKVKSQLRRYYQLSNKHLNNLNINGVSLDEATFTISYNNNKIELSKNEFKLIKKLLTSHGEFVTRQDLLEALWDEATFVDENTLNVNVSRVKQRLNDVNIPYSLKTKRGVGYKLEIELTGELNE